MIGDAIKFVRRLADAPALFEFQGVYPIQLITSQTVLDLDGAIAVRQAEHLGLAIDQLLRGI